VRKIKRPGSEYFWYLVTNIKIWKYKWGIKKKKWIDLGKDVIEL
jgi:hypothetical protein